MSRPKLLDLYCCEGGATVGYQRAGYDVYGVDLEPRFAKRYPGTGFHAGSALDVLTVLIAGGTIAFTRRDGTVEHLALADFDAIHASPPCQGYTIATAGNPEARAKHERLIAATRTLLEQTHLPWIIENVEQAASQMVDPITLCGRMFGLETDDEDGMRLVLDRHRLFESSVRLAAPAHPRHDGRQVAGVYGGSRRSSLPNATPADDRYAARVERRGGVRTALDPRPAAATRDRLDDPARHAPVAPAGLHRVPRAPAASAVPGGGGMSALTCLHPDHEAQDDRRAYEPGWEAAHHHKVIHGHSPVPAPAAAPVDLPPPPAPRLNRGTDGLTDQQRTVRRLYLAGMTNSDIANELRLTPNAINTTVYRLRRKGHLDRPAQEVTT